MKAQLPTQAALQLFEFLFSDLLVELNTIIFVLFMQEECVSVVVKHVYWLLQSINQAQ